MFLLKHHVFKQVNKVISFFWYVLSFLFCNSGKTYVETRFQKTQIQNSMTGDPRSKSAHYKTSAFVPPFVRNAKTETHKTMVLKDSIRIPSAFVPPFKKQRTIVEESSCKAHEGEDKHQKPFVMSSNSKCFVPPTKKTQGAADGTAVAAARSDDMNSQSLPVDFRSVSAVGETSGVDGTCSRRQGAVNSLRYISVKVSLWQFKKKSVCRCISESSEHWAGTGYTRHEAQEEEAPEHSTSSRELVS